MISTSTSGRRRRARPLVAAVVAAAVTSLLAAPPADANPATPQLRITDGSTVNSGDDYIRAFGTGATGGTDAAGSPLLVSLQNYTCPAGTAGLDLYLSPNIETSLTAAGTAYESETAATSLEDLEPIHTNLLFDPISMGYDPVVSRQPPRNGGTAAAVLGDNGYWTIRSRDLAPGGLAKSSANSILQPARRYTLGAACETDAGYLVPDPDHPARYASVQSYLTINADHTWTLSTDPTTLIGTTVELDANRTNSAEGDPVSLLAFVPFTPDGTVDYYSDGYLIGHAQVIAANAASGSAMLTTSGLFAGVHTLKAIFHPDNTSADAYHQYAASTSATISHRVTINPVATTTTITSTPASYGHRAAVTVRVTNAGDRSATGFVTLSTLGAAQTRPVGAGGAVRFTLPATLTAGVYPLTASYTGDDQLDPSTGHAVLSVAKASSHVKIKWLKQVKRRKRAKIKIVVAASGGSASGIVRIKVGRHKTTAHLEHGHVTAKIKLRPPGKQGVVVAYPGTANVAASRAKATLHVK